MKRYRTLFSCGCGSYVHSVEEAGDGEWCKYEDVEILLAEGSVKNDALNGIMHNAEMLLCNKDTVTGDTLTESDRRLVTIGIQDMAEKALNSVSTQQCQHEIGGTIGKNDHRCMKCGLHLDDIRNPIDPECSHVWHCDQCPFCGEAN